MSEDIKYKSSQNRLWRLGCFGNKLRTWSTPDEVPDHYKTGNLLSMRHNKPQGKFLYRLWWEDIRRLWTPDYYIMESIDDTNRIVQGELYTTVRGWEFWYSFKQGPLGTVTRSSALKLMFGFQVQLYLQQIMYPLSYENLQELINQYPNAIIELSIFNQAVGDTPGNNTIFWEVREY